MSPHNPDLFSQRANLWVPLVVGVAFSVMVGIMWISFDRQREDNLRELVTSEAKLRASLIDVDIRTRIPALQRAVERWQRRGGTPKAEFFADAKAYIDDLPGFQALEWVDRNHYVRWVVPLKGNEQAQDLYLAFEETRHLAIEEASEMRVPITTAPIDLIQGGKGFLVYFPIYVHGKFDGFLLAVIKIAPWLDYVFKLQKDHAYFNTVVSINNEPVYEQQNMRGNNYAEWKAASHIEMGGHNVKVEILPTQAFFIANKSSLPEISVAIGLLLTALVTYVVHAVFLLRVRIAERDQAEEALRQAHDNLEEKVEERTAELNMQIKERRHLERQLLRSQRMEAIGQLTGGVAHDFNNLMGVMIGNAELLRDMVGKDENARRCIDAITKAVDRGASLTNRLLAFSRKQTLSPQPTAINRLVAGLEDMLQRTLGEAIELRVHFGSGIRDALIDAHQCEDALVNLAINARDAMPRGGLLTIGTANVTLDKAYAEQHEEVTPGDYVMITVSDTGSGITPEVLEKVFEPFFSTKEVGKGSGLGLSMVYGFAKQSGGHVMIDSEVGHGTTAKLYLPQSRKTIAQEGWGETHDLALGSGRILVVEDDADVRVISTSILLNQGYQVVEAKDGKEAIKRLQDVQPFDLLFTDVVLPGGMNGIEVAEEARRLQPGIKVLYTTGYAESVVMHNGKMAPDITLVSKPYHRQELLEKVQEMLDGEGN